MSAYLNALREEGSRNELLRQIEKLYGEHNEAIREISRLGRELGTTEARLAEAVEVMEMALKCTPSVIVPSNGGPKIIYDCGDPWELLRAFLAKLEFKRSEDIIREDRDEWDARLEGRS